MRTRREFIIASTVPLTAPFSASTPPTERKEFQYEQLRWVDESEDPSLLLETEQLALKVIDNTGLRTRPRRNIHSWMEPNFSHHIGYHGIRTLWRKDERRNVVQPFASWLNLQMLEVEGLELDPIDSRAWAGVGRGWPIRMEREPAGVRLMISRMPVSGIEYSLRITPSGADSIDFEMSFTLHKKTKSPAEFTA
jgi:hypothetical protein